MIAISRNLIKVSDRLIRSYYYIEFDQKEKNHSGVIIDDACYELMFVKEENVKFIDGNNQKQTLSPTYTLNNLKRPFRFDFKDTFTTFCIKLQPWMNASYIPTKESQLLDLNKLYPDQILELHKKIFLCENMEERIQHAEKFLLSLDVQMNVVTNLIHKICQLYK